ncbi:hypothetical protein E8E11_000417 [Didymella keratinophila]|nr:hypothetical protein E8E11_000417 [Didymella keratinophila]
MSVLLHELCHVNGRADVEVAANDTFIGSYVSDEGRKAFCDMAAKASSAKPWTLTGNWIWTDQAFFDAQLTVLLAEEDQSADMALSL